MGTNVVALSSDLKRKGWMREGLLQAASQSFWSPLTGTSKDSVVFQAKNGSASSGHTVVFDFDGNLTGRAIKGKDTAYGKGEEKKKFSDKLTVERYRLVVNNGDKFDGVDIDATDLNNHVDSRTKLGDLFTRFKDQQLFDAAQGLRDQAPTHIFDLGTTFGYNSLLDIERNIKMSKDFTTGSTRRPLAPYTLANGKPCWLFIIDTDMANKLKQDTSFQTLMSNADIRGDGNRIITGALAKIGSLIIIEADTFFGKTDGTTQGWDINESDIEISGLRQYDGASAASALWTGQTGFDSGSANLHSRGIIVGAGALQLGYGQQPDYKYQESTDFGITSESALEVWMESKKTKMTAEQTDYESAKVADIDWGVIAVDVGV